MDMESRDADEAGRRPAPTLLVGTKGAVKAVAATAKSAIHDSTFIWFIIVLLRFSVQDGGDAST